jgi:hypothetical protein
VVGFDTSPESLARFLSGVSLGVSSGGVCAIFTVLTCAAVSKAEVARRAAGVTGGFAEVGAVDAD